ncbi:MAG TPA: RNA polymerase sigma factor RpoD/SigA [Chitinophagales bacterium]|nr:RNA polymerase sigma factor RpoD/SigA [Chitinophagales bacterium]HMX04624.1 RNA polymerase sigma factor RpoD/SigA [Chitinophagales bacterium]HMZ89945.1 RNA polymerase sigma factor RpoD/SigA [Chitinophagales bacterium]HNA57434.1 RNA polymerase sigma factor RpoD/SigA [Chitinophagales bacterium]HNE46469.1 RNA polymerase sigma factor RpoD/SigA [Chitinophagales bacterium]
MRQLKITASITSRENDSLEKYLAEIGKIDMITPEEEAVLAKRIREGDTVALDTLTKANLRFVVSVAKQYQGHGLTLSDLINEGNVGLIKAAKKFDETKGFKFISYAVWWIRQSIMLGIVEHSRLIRLPLNKAGNVSKVNKLTSQFEQEFERDPTPEEIAETLHLKDDDVRDIIASNIRHISMDAPLGNDGDDGSMADILADTGEDTPDSGLVSESLREEIASALKVLSEREAEVVAAYYGISGYPSMTVEEIAKKFNLSRERVRQIKERAIRRLRKATMSSALKNYLG